MDVGILPGLISLFVRMGIPISLKLTLCPGLPPPASYPKVLPARVMIFLALSKDWSLPQSKDFLNYPYNLQHEVPNKKKSEPSTCDLLPNSSRRPASKTAMRKRSLSFAKSALVVICLGMVGVGFWWGSQRDVYETVLLWNKMDEPVKQVTFESDGVLDHRWFQNWFGPLRDRTLMQIDIDDLHSELIKEPQIAYAQVRRIFPSTLEVKILEENPVLVVRLGKKGGGVQDWMISADGDLYQGVGYTRQILSLLPSLSISPKQLQIDPNGRGYRKLEEFHS